MLVSILYKSIQKPQMSEKKGKFQFVDLFLSSALHFLLHLYLTSIFNFISRGNFQPKPPGEKFFFSSPELHFLQIYLEKRIAKYRNYRFL